MARIRTIKPEFCSSNDVGALTRDARLFFLQLLTEADDEGRLLWIPRRLAGVLYPFDTDIGDGEIENWAAECEGRGMVKRYNVGNASYLAIVNWSKHQRIDHKGKSRFPAPEDESGSPRESFAKVSRSPRESVAPDLGTGNREKEQGITNPDGLVVAGKPAPPPCPQSEIVSLYHEVLPSLRRVREWTNARQTMLRKRWSEDPARQNLDWWREFFDYVAQSDFLMGRTQGQTGEGFDCDLEWLLRPKNFVKVIEGKYENRRAA